MPATTSANGLTDPTGGAGASGGGGTDFATPKPPATPWEAAGMSQADWALQEAKKQGRDYVGGPVVRPPTTPPTANGWTNTTSIVNPDGSTPTIAKAVPPAPLDASLSDEEKARQLAAALAAQAAQQKARAAPTVTAPPPLVAPQSAPVTVGGVAAPTAGYVVAPSPVTAQVIAPSVVAGTPQISAGVVAHNNIGPTALVNPSVVAPVTHAASATIDTDPQAQFRAQQATLFSGLQAAADGTGPSAAALTAQKATDAAIAAQRSAEASAHGTGIVGARWQANNNIASITQKAAADAGILKAQEQQTARQQLLTGLDAARGTDVSLATSQAGLQQQTLLANMSADNVKGLKDADLAQAAALGNQAAINEQQYRQASLNQTADTTTAQLALDAAKSNQGVTATKNLTDAELASKAATSNQDTALRAGIASAGNELDAGKANATNTTTTSIADASNQTKLAADQAELATRTAISNSGLQATADINSADNQLKAAVAAAGFTLQGRSLDDARNVAALDEALKAQGQVLTSDAERMRNETVRAQLALAVKTGDRNFIAQIAGGILGFTGSLGSSLISSGAFKTGGSLGSSSDTGGGGAFTDSSSGGATGNTDGDPTGGEGFSE